MEASALQAPSGVGRFRSSAGTPFLRLRSDEQLVELFRAGHEEAFRVIHDRYRARLFAYTRQMLPNSRHDAEDALQDVFIRAYSGLRASDRHLALRAWLYRVAHNRCVDHLRKNMPIVSDEIEVTSQDVSTDPMAAVQQREDLRKLVADVQRLPEQQRSALLLRELSGMSYQELADSMELSVPAIKSLLVRARTGLNAAAEARDVDCASIRSELVDSHEHGQRPSALTRRHLSDCAACREYRDSVRGVSKSLAALVPAGPLVLGLKVLGVGSVYSAAAYSGTAGGGAAAGGAVASGAAASGAAVSGAAAAGAAAAGAAAAGGAAAGGAAVGSAAAGGAIVSGVSAGHIAAIIAAAAAAGGAVAVTQQSTPHKSVAPVHPAAALISKAVHSAVAHGYSPAAAVASLAPLAGAAKTVTPAAPSSQTAVSGLRHAGAATSGTSTVTTPGAAATTTTPTASTTSTTPSSSSPATTASGAVPVLAGSSTTATPAGATSAVPTGTMLSGGAPVSTIATPSAASTPSAAAAGVSATTARTDSTPPTSATIPSAATPTTPDSASSSNSGVTSPTNSGASSTTPAGTSSASTTLGSTSGAAPTAPSTEPSS